MDHPPLNQECRHLDDDQINCHLYNLRWGTYAENRQDMFDNKKAAIGSRHGNAKLTEAIVATARERYIPYSRTDGTSALASEFGVSPEIMYKALHHHSWKHIK